MDRAEQHAATAHVLAGLGDDELADLVTAGTVLGAGIGGSTVRLDLESTPVFVKRVPLTARESQRSTANVYNLPTFYEYPVGSAGFGAWRELAAHELTTSWVLGGDLDCFPMLHHWRILPRPPSPTVGVEADVAFWEGSAAVRDRLKAIAVAELDLVLFCEFVPQTVRQWLAASFAEGNGAAAVTLVEHRLLNDVRDMNALGLWHFDTHFNNVLTDGERFYLGDLGLACTPMFELAVAERDFLRANRNFDWAYTLTALVNWLVANVAGVTDPLPRNAFVAGVTQTGDAAGLPPEVADVVRRHAPVAALVNAFVMSLHTGSKTTPWPSAEIDRASSNSR